MSMCHKNDSSVINSIYSGQQRFSYTGRWIDKQRDERQRERQTDRNTENIFSGFVNQL